MAINKDNIKKDIEDLSSYLKSENYKGYDPYDTLSSWVPFRFLGGRWAQFAAAQIQLRNPVNLRPLLGIKKIRGVKATAIILQGLSLYYRANPDEGLKKEMDELFEWIVENRTDGFKGSCWGVPFPLAMADKSRQKNDPSAVLASFVTESIFEYYLSTGNPKVKEIIEGVVEFIKNHIPVTERPEGKCYSYTSKVKDIVYNANSFVAETFAKAYYFNKDESLKEEAVKCIDFNIAHQKEDGRWAYSMNSNTGTERELIDFHQGFVLNSIHDVSKILGLTDKKYSESIDKGLKYYRHKQFTDIGESIWRVPKKYPIDAHNQGVGILTFAKLSEYGQDYLDFAVKIAEWSDMNLKNEKKGYYYYQKTPLYTNKISYIRWNQAWMLLGLAHLYLKLSEKKVFAPF
jgi:hypothetical protein